MGAQSDSRVFEATDRNDATNKARRIMDDDRRQNGYDYSGTIGMATGTFYDSHIAADETAAFFYTFGTPANNYDDCKVEKYDDAILMQLADGRWFIGAECSC